MDGMTVLAIIGAAGAVVFLLVIWAVHEIDKMEGMDDGF